MNYQQAIFEAVASGSLYELHKILNSCGRELTTELAKSLNNKGETPLLVAVQGNHKQVVRFLVDELHVSVGQISRFLWKGVDYLQVPPIFAAIICDKLPHHPIINFLIDRDVANPVVLDCVLSSSIPHSQKIDILEIIGAVYVVSCALRKYKRSIAMDFWFHATSLRQSTAAEPAIPKLPYNLSGRDQRIFGQPFEFSTVEQLNELPNQPYYSPIITEALLSLRRITIQIDPEPNLFFLSGLFWFGYDKFFFVPQREHGQMIDVGLLILDHFQDRHWEDIICEWSCEIVRFVLSVMGKCFRHNSGLPQNNPKRQELFANMMKGLVCASTFAAKFKTNVDPLLNTIGNVKNYIFNMVSILSKMQRELNEEECRQLKQWLYRYVQFDYTDDGNGETLLHWICSLQNIPLDFVRLLLEVKANHKALNRSGRTPLHVVANNWPSRANIVEVADLLMDAGSHLNQADIHGVTSLQLFQEMHHRLSAEGLLDTALNLEDLIHPVVLPLTCYCAQSIRKHKIPFKQLIPPVAESFVERHGELPLELL